MEKEEKIRWWKKLVRKKTRSVCFSLSLTDKKSVKRKLYCEARTGTKRTFRAVDMKREEKEDKVKFLSTLHLTTSYREEEATFSQSLPRSL